MFVQCDARMYINSRENARWSIVMLCIWLHAYLSIFNSPHWNSWTRQDEPNPHPQLKGLIHETKSCMLSNLFENLTKLCENHVPVHLNIVQLHC